MSGIPSPLTLTSGVPTTTGGPALVQEEPYEESEPPGEAPELPSEARLVPPCPSGLPRRKLSFPFAGERWTPGSVVITGGWSTVKAFG